MNDKEFIAALKDMDNDTLMDNLEDLGGDGYYQELRSAIIAEIRKRLTIPRREEEIALEEIVEEIKRERTYRENRNETEELYEVDVILRIIEPYMRGE